MILVSGATGNAGGAVAQALAERDIAHRALVRTPEHARLPQQTEVAQGDLNDPDSVAPALDGVDGLFLLAGYDRAEETLRRAREAGVRRVVLISSSSAAGRRTDNAIAQYNLAAEATLATSGIAHTVLRPNAFMANALRWLPQLRDGDVVRVQFPDVALSSVDPRDIADVAVAALTTDAHAGATYRLTGPEAQTPPERVAILGAAIGRPLTAQGLTLDETRAELRASMPEPYAAAMEQFYADGVIDETSVNDTVPTVTGHPARTFAQWCRDHADAFTT